MESSSLKKADVRKNREILAKIEKSEERDRFN